MSNFQVRLALTKLKNSCIMDIKGRSGSKKCLVIPIEDNHIYEGKEAYLTLTAQERSTPSQYGDTHFLKPYVSKDVYNALSEEEKKSIPIIGSMSPTQYGGTKDPQVQTGHSDAPAQVSSDNDDMPF